MLSISAVPPNLSLQRDLFLSPTRPTALTLRLRRPYSFSFSLLLMKCFSRATNAGFPLSPAHCDAVTQSTPLRLRIYV